MRRNSKGWRDWPVDLGPFAGRKIEVAISVITDRGTLWVDDAKVTLDGAQASLDDFEVGTGSWQLGPSPEGTANPVVGWERVTEGAVVATDDPVFSGFGFEGSAEPRGARSSCAGADAPRRDRLAT